MKEQFYNSSFSGERIYKTGCPYCGGHLPAPAELCVLCYQTSCEKCGFPFGAHLNMFDPGCPPGITQTYKLGKRNRNISISNVDKTRKTSHDLPEIPLKGRKKRKRRSNTDHEKAQEHYSNARKHRDAGDLDSAINASNLATQADPLYAPAWYELARIYEAKKYSLHSIAPYYQRFIELAENNRRLSKHVKAAKKRIKEIRKREEISFEKNLGNYQQPSSHGGQSLAKGIVKPAIKFGRKVLRTIFVSVVAIIFILALLLTISDLF